MQPKSLNQQASPSTMKSQPKMNAYSPISSPRKGRTRFGLDTDSSASPPSYSSPISKELPFTPVRQQRQPSNILQKPDRTPNIEEGMKNSPTALSHPTIEFEHLQVAHKNLEKTLRQTKSLLKESERSSDWWKSRVKVLDRRSRALEAENKALLARVTELEAATKIEEEIGNERSSPPRSTGSASSGEGIEDIIDDEEANKENTKPHLKPLQEIPRIESLNIEDEVKEQKYKTIVQDLISHHLNMQAELATDNKGSNCCDCAAAQTIKNLFTGIHTATSTSPQSQSTSPVRSTHHIAPSSVPGASPLKSSPDPQAEMFNSLRHERKRVLKRRISEMRNYVNGLMGENDILEKIIQDNQAQSPQLMTTHDWEPWDEKPCKGSVELEMQKSSSENSVSQL